MRKTLSSFTTEKQEYRCLLSYLSIRHQFVNPQWAVCGRIWKNKIPGVPRLPDEFEFEVVFKYRLVTELHCVHKVQSLSWLWSLLKTEFKWIQNLVNNIYASGQKPNKTIFSFHSITQQTNLGWVSSYVGWATCVEKKWLRNLFKTCVLQSGFLLSYTSLIHIWVHWEKKTCNTTKLHGKKGFVKKVFGFNVQSVWIMLELQLLVTFHRITETEWLTSET